MTAKDALQKIKELLMSKQEEVVEVKKFNTMTLKEGKKIAYDTFEAGSVISNMLEDETIEDMVAGEYEMEDGQILIIDEFSKVVEIKAAEVVEEAVVETETETEVVEPTLEEKFTAMEEKYSKMEEAINVLLQTLTGQDELMSSLKSELSKRIEAIEKAPATEPVHYSKEEVREETVAERRSRALDLLKK